MPGPFELHLAAKRGNITRVRELLREGANINREDSAGRTPLMYALGGPASVELVQILLDRGADLHYTRPNGYNALVDAAYSLAADRSPRSLGVLKILLHRGVELNAITTYQESALRVLSDFGRIDAIQLLLDAGADEAQLAWTPLHRAVALGNLTDVKSRVEKGDDIESVDWWECTPWLLAIKTGDIEKARHLARCGANLTATGKGGVSALDLAIESFSIPMLKWLIGPERGIAWNSDPTSTPLLNAVRAGNHEAVDVLIRAGADVNQRLGAFTALGEARTREIALRLMDAGADPADLSFEGRRAILGFDPEPDELLFDATTDDFHAAPTARWGSDNPEPMDLPFWHAMIRSGITASACRELIGAGRDDGPVWCAQRFGQSITLLPDGRAIQIGGEHEDSYDKDFCIYNDVFVHHPDGRIHIFTYPEDIFPPTDFHTATLIGDSIYIIGRLGYRGTRAFGETPVYRLSINTLKISRMETTGDLPGWISGHRAVLASPHEIQVSSGKISADAGGEETYKDNHDSWILNLSEGRWRRERQ